MASAVTPPPALCTIDSIKLGTKELSKEQSQNFLVARIEAFVQTEIFKNAVNNSPGTYRLKLNDGAIVLEKQNGDNWERKELTPSASAATVATTTTAAASSNPLQENQDLKTFTAAFRHFENAARFQENLRSAHNNNSCWLDSGLSLVRNIPSLYEKFVSDKALPQENPKSEKLKKLRHVQNGAGIREALDIDNTQPDDPLMFFGTLDLGSKDKRLATVTTEIKAQNKLESLNEQEKLTLTQLLNLYENNEAMKLLDTDERSSLRAALIPNLKDSSVKLNSRNSKNLKDLLQGYQKPSDVTLNNTPNNPTYTITRTIDYSQPLLIELKSESMQPGRNGQVAKEPIQMNDVPNFLEKEDKKLHLNGFLVHTGGANGGHWVAYFRKLELNGDYKWYKDDDTATGIEEVSEKKALEDAKKTATYLYYDPDNYDTSDQDSRLHSRRSSVSSNVSLFSASEELL